MKKQKILLLYNFKGGKWEYGLPDVKITVETLGILFKIDLSLAK